MPAAARKPQTLADLRETALIESIRRWLGASSPSAPEGIGDDCAVLPKTRSRQLVTTDPVIRGKHFDDTIPPHRVAEKLLKRNLSDIAAMGGTPMHAVVSLTAPKSLRIKWLRDFYRGLGRCAVNFGVEIVGGDCTCADDFLGAYLTLLGRAGSRVLTRDGARAGDLLYVSGNLGGSLLGKHARFQPRLAEGRWLARHRAVRACIDLSDGLGKDLPAIVPQGTRAVIECSRLPVSASAKRAAADDQRHVLDHVLNDGEDFELLFAVGARQAPVFERAWGAALNTPLTRIGRLEPKAHSEPAVRFQPALPKGIEPRGYEHFR